MEREEFIAGLEKYLALLKSHPNLPAPLNGVNFCCYLWGDDAKEKLAQCIRDCGGKWEKQVSDDFYGFRQSLAGPSITGVVLHISVQRDAVCRRIVKTETIPARPAQTVTLDAVPERTVEKVEWECLESILAPQDQASELRERVAEGARS